MPQATVTSSDNLPLMLRVRDVQNIVGCSRNVPYDLAHASGCVMYVGTARRIHRDKFLAWLERQTTTRNEAHADQ